MIKYGLGVFTILLGLAALTVAIMAYRELNAAATSETPPSVDSMWLNKIINPELFDPGKAGTKPAELAQTALNRIYMVGGVALVLAVVGIIVLAIPQSREAEERES